MLSAMLMFDFITVTPGKSIGGTGEYKTLNFLRGRHRVYYVVYRTMLESSVRLKHVPEMMETLRSNAKRQSILGADDPRLAEESREICYNNCLY